MKRILAVGAALMAAFLIPTADAQQRRSTPARTATPAPTPPPTPAPAPVPVTYPNISSPIARATSPYVAFQGDITSLRTSALSAPTDLDRAFNTAISNNPQGITKGFLSYSAIVAAQNPAFARSVRDTAAFYGRDRFLMGLRNDVKYARTLGGAEGAVQLVLASAAADGARIEAVGERFREAAYSLQRSSWSNQVAPRPQPRIAELRNLSNTPRWAPANFVEKVTVQVGRQSSTVSPDGVGGGLFWDALMTQTEAATLASYSAPPPRAARPGPAEQHTLDRIMTMAAFYIVGAGDDQQARIDVLSDDPTTKNCIEMARLQALQCVSASRFRYEHSFCLGLHVLKDTGTCLKQVVQPS
jgi:hypothetical protein